MNLYQLDDRFYNFVFGLHYGFVVLVFLLIAFYKIFIFYKIKRSFFLFLAMIECAIFYSYDPVFGSFVGICFGLMFLLSLLDAESLMVPTKWNFLFACLGIFAIYFRTINFDIVFLEGFALVGFFAILQNFGRYILDKEILGDGDLIFVLGLCLIFGLKESLYAIFIGSILGSIFIYLKSRQKQMPMITLMSFGIVFEFVLGLIDV